MSSSSSRADQVRHLPVPEARHGTGYRSADQPRRLPKTALEEEHPTGEALFYKARVALSDPQLRDVPKDFKLIPGMALQAEIRTGKRSVLSYFLYPIMRGLDEGIREW